MANSENGTEIKAKAPFLGDDEIVHYRFTEKEIVDRNLYPSCLFCNFLCKRTNNSNKSSN